MNLTKDEMKDELKLRCVKKTKGNKKQKLCKTNCISLLKDVQ